MLPRVLKNFNLFIAGQGYAGRIEEITLPKLVLRTEEFRQGGLDTPVQIDLGMEKLECEMSLSEYDAAIIKRFGIEHRQVLPFAPPGGALGASLVNTAAGFSVDNQIPLVIRGGLSGEQERRVVPLEIKATGTLIELDMGQWQVGQHPRLRLRMALRYYRLDLDKETLVEIDVDNRVRKIDGTDQIRVGFF